MNTIGSRISELRKVNGFTQDSLAEKCNVSPQAVSKWENDLAIPDISILINLAEIFNVTVDEILRGNQSKAVRVVPKEARKPLEHLMLRLTVDTQEGDKVRINLPVTVLEILLQTQADFSMNDKQILTREQLELIMNMIQVGTIGELLTVDSADGEHVAIFVE